MMKNVGDLKRLFRCAFMATTVVTVLVCELMSHLIYNRTESLPLGLYWLERDVVPRVGDMVAFPVPAAVRGLVRERRYLPDGAYLVKTVVAAGGDWVCSEGDGFSVNGKRVGAVLEEDSAGRPLPQDKTCGRVAAAEVYVASEHPRSFDSRAFGAIRLDDIRGKVVALWTY